MIIGTGDCMRSVPFDLHAWMSIGPVAWAIASTAIASGVGGCCAGAFSAWDGSVRAGGGGRGYRFRHVPVTVEQGG